QAESLDQACRTSREVTVGDPALGGTAPASRKLLPVDDLATAQQHRRGRTRLTTDEVGTVVHAVGEVDVEASRGPEHRPGPRRLAAVGVRSRVVAAVVRLDL